MQMRAFGIDSGIHARNQALMREAPDGATVTRLTWVGFLR